MSAVTGRARVIVRVLTPADYPLRYEGSCRDCSYPPMRGESEAYLVGWFKSHVTGMGHTVEIEDMAPKQ